jgi:glycosyltransferase involved in cell wall biosynthesis
MARVLLVAYAYPPLAAPGSIRPAGLAKYLPRFGWDVRVLTPKLPIGSRVNSHIIETEYKSVVAQWKSTFGIDPQRSAHEALNLPLPSKPNANGLHTKLLQCTRGLLAFPDEQRGWIRFAVEAISKLSAKEKPDVIVSTSPPASAHLIAREARRFLKCAWVADLRDLWTESLWGPLRLLQPLHRRLERRTLEMADAMVTVSVPWANSLRKKYRSAPIYTIPNGFDPDDFRSRAVALTEHFSLTYTGHLYEGRRDPTLLFEVLHDLLAEGLVSKDEIRVRFYGPPEPWLPGLIERYRLQEIVQLGGIVPREEALKRQSESQLLLLLGWSDPKETGQHTGKLFEYFGSERPILAVGGAVGVLTDTLNETGTGVHISDRVLLRQYLLSAYAEFKRKGFVSCHADQAAVTRYTHMEMARKFSGVLTATLGGRQGQLAENGMDGSRSGCTHPKCSVTN